MAAGKETQIQGTRAGGRRKRNARILDGLDWLGLETTTRNMEPTGRNKGGGECLHLPLYVGPTVYPARSGPHRCVATQVGVSASTPPTMHEHSSVGRTWGFCTKGHLGGHPCGAWRAVQGIVGAENSSSKAREVALAAAPLQVGGQWIARYTTCTHWKAAHYGCTHAGKPVPGAKGVLAAPRAPCLPVKGLPSCLISSDSMRTGVCR